MTKTSKPGLIAIVLAAFVIAIMPAAGHAQKRGVLREILHRMDLNIKSLHSLRADVRMERYDSQLREIDLYTGSAIYLAKKKKRPVYTRIDWTKPVQESLVLAGDKYDLYRPRLRQRYIGTISSAESKIEAPHTPFDFMTMSAKQLRANSVINYLGQATVGEVRTWRIEIVPRQAATYQTAEMWIDSHGMPVKTKIIAKNKDTTTVILSNIKKNPKIKPAVFKIDIPDGIKLIKG